MSAAGWFVAGWICCALFVLAGVLYSRRQERAQLDAQDTDVFLHACEREIGTNADGWKCIGRRWYPPATAAD